MKALLTTKQVEQIDKIKFAKTTLNKNKKVFAVYITSFSLRKRLIIRIHPAGKAQIVLLLAKKIKILAKYSDFSNTFLERRALVLQEIIELNQHIIKLQNS